MSLTYSGEERKGFDIGYSMARKGKVASKKLPCPSVQVVQESAAQKFLDLRRKDQQKALQLLRDTPGLR